jgi:hypothetical protein
MQTSGGGSVNDEFGPYAVPERAERFAKLGADLQLAPKSTAWP